MARKDDLLVVLKNAGIDPTGLSADQLKAAQDAIAAILMARMTPPGGGGGGGLTPPEIEIDPDLLQPEQPGGDSPKANFDDPEDLLKKQRATQRKSGKQKETAGKPNPDKEGEGALGQLKKEKEEEDKKARGLHKARIVKMGKAAASRAKTKGECSPADIQELEDAIAELEQVDPEDSTNKEMSEAINKVLDAAQKVSNITVKSDDETKAQIAEIQAELNNEQSNQELEDEIYDEISRETQSILKAREQENQRYGTGKITGSGFEMFRMHLYRAIKDQVDRVEEEEETWSMPNRHHVNDGIVAKGEKEDDRLDDAYPTIAVFFDRSGSCAGFTQQGIKCIETLREFEVKGECKLDLYYFGNHVSNDIHDPRIGGGTSGWGEIMDTVIDNKYKNVIVLTDDDVNTWGDHRKTKRVEGCVWYLWVYGSAAPNVTKELTGRMGTYQFNIGN